MRTERGYTVLVLLAGVIAGLISSVPCMAQSPASYRLTLQDAIQKALRANLGVLVAGTRVEEAEGARLRRLSAALLPRVNTQASANYQNRNLRAFGISLPDMPEVVGPFSNYDFRVYAQQNLVDLQSYRAYKASQLALDAGKLDYKDARDLIVCGIAALYLDAQSADARVRAAQSRVTDAEALSKLADDKHSAGTATGVDVLRAQVQLANERQALLVDENQYKQSLLSLARNLGMNPGTPLELAQPLEFQPLTEPQIQTVVSAALVTRADYLSLVRQRESLVEQERANRARSYPKLSVNGNFGGIGRSVGGMQATGLIQGQIDFTIFDRDRKGEGQELAAQVERIDDQIADGRAGLKRKLAPRCSISIPRKNRCQLPGKDRGWPSANWG